MEGNDFEEFANLTSNLPLTWPQSVAAGCNWADAARLRTIWRRRRRRRRKKRRERGERKERKDEDKDIK